MPFFSSLDNLLKDAYVIFQEGVDYFEIEQKKKKLNFGRRCSTPLKLTLTRNLLLFVS